LTTRLRKQILIGIDELDYLQGISLKLLAFECFLQINPAFANKVRRRCRRDVLLLVGL
jgi:trehalose-6-phosphate synthase